MSEPVYEKLIFENSEKGFQIKLVISEFRDIEYLHLRKYFMSFEDGYVPTKEGISIPVSIQSVHALLDGLIEICAKAEGMDSIQNHLASKLSDLNLQD